MAEIDSTLALSVEDIAAVDSRLQDVVHSLRAIYRLAAIAMDDNGDDVEHYLNAVKEMARANVKGVCACLDKLTNARMGNFETEFDRE